MPSISAVDLFCGVGGLTHGLRKAGIVVVAGYDIDQACRWPYEKNNGRAKFLQADVGGLTGAELQAHFDDDDEVVTLLAGCAPCQPFSAYSLHKPDETDHRWPMLEQFGRLVTELKPTLVTMENVPQIRKHEVFDDFVATLGESGYWVSVKVVKCEEYGIPQARSRLVLLASRLGEIKLRERDAKRDKRRTVRSAIKKLEKLTAGEASKSDPIHRTSRLTELNAKRMKAARPGGSWRDWDPKLLASCHKTETGKSFPGVYGRMEWDSPAPTITTQFYGFGSGRFGHPEQNRALSLREGAILQTFPPKYKFVKRGEKIHMTTVGRLIGNAVPVRLGKVIGESLIAHVEAHASEPKGKLPAQPPGVPAVNS
jgi:DNA (cytosine-5)-methyltransferase 1